jgi:DnaB-like helicase C terminal domain
MKYELLVQIFIGRCIESPDFLKIEGKRLAESPTEIVGAKLKTALNILIDFLNKGSPLRRDTIDSFAPPTLKRYLAKEGVVYGSSLGDLFLTQSVMRGGLLLSMHDQLSQMEKSFNVTDEAWERLTKMATLVPKASDTGAAADGYAYGQHLYLTRSMGQVYHAYTMDARDRLLGRNFTSGIPLMDEMGMRPTRRDTMLIVGPQGTGKSFLVDYILHRNAERGFKGIVFTLEMTAIDRSKRMELMLTRAVAKESDVCVKLPGSVAVPMSLFDSSNYLGLPHIMRAGALNSEIDTQFTMGKIKTGEEVMIPITGAITNSSGDVNPVVYSKSSKERRVLMETGGEVVFMPLEINNATMYELEETLKKLAREENFVPDIIAVDYLALMEGGQGVDFIAKMIALSQGLKGIAQKYNVACINVHQGKVTPLPTAQKKAEAAGQITEVGGVKLAMPLLGTHSIYGASAMKNEPAVIVTMTPTLAKGVGLVLKAEKLRNAPVTDTVVFVNTALPHRFALSAEVIPL